MTAMTAGTTKSDIQINCFVQEFLLTHDTGDCLNDGPGSQSSSSWAGPLLAYFGPAEVRE